MCSAFPKHRARARFPLLSILSPTTHGWKKAQIMRPPVQGGRAGNGTRASRFHRLDPVPLPGVRERARGPQWDAAGGPFSLRGDHLPQPGVHVLKWAPERQAIPPDHLATVQAAGMVDAPGTIPRAGEGRRKREDYCPCVRHFGGRGVLSPRRSRERDRGAARPGQAGGGSPIRHGGRDRRDLPEDRGQDGLCHHRLGLHDPQDARRAGLGHAQGSRPGRCVPGSRTQRDRGGNPHRERGRVGRDPSDGCQPPAPRHAGDTQAQGPLRQGGHPDHRVHRRRKGHH